jgi:hypothetical protein
MLVDLVGGNLDFLGGGGSERGITLGVTIYLIQLSLKTGWENPVPSGSDSSF